MHNTHERILIYTIMKKTLLTVCAAVASIALVSCNNSTTEEKTEAEQTTVETATAVSASIVYFDIDRVMAGYDMANELSSTVQDKINSIEKDLKNRQTKFQNAVNDFTTKYQKGLMTTAAAQDQQKKLQEQEATLLEYSQKKQNEVLEEQQVAMNQVLDAIHTFVKEYNETAGHDMILCNQGNVPVIVANPELDITDFIIQSLNEQYVQSKK